MGSVFGFVECAGRHVSLKLMWLPGWPVFRVAMVTVHIQITFGYHLFTESLSPEIEKRAGVVVESTGIGDQVSWSLFIRLCN